MKKAAPSLEGRGFLVGAVSGGLAPPRGAGILVFAVCDGVDVCAGQTDIVEFAIGQRLEALAGQTASFQSTIASESAEKKRLTEAAIS